MVNHERAEIVGRRDVERAGLGDLRGGEAVAVLVIALPVAAYYTWNGTFLEGRGVAPDMEEPFSVSAIRSGRDAQLQRAIDVANEL